MPSVRIDKEFGVPSDQLDSETLFQEAKKEILIAQQAYDELIAAKEETSVGDE